jgi:hypothetical protein
MDANKLITYINSDLRKYLKYTETYYIENLRDGYIISRNDKSEASNRSLTSILQKSPDVKRELERQFNAEIEILDLRTLYVSKDVNTKHVNILKYYLDEGNNAEFGEYLYSGINITTKQAVDLFNYALSANNLTAAKLVLDVKYNSRNNLENQDIFDFSLQDGILFGGIKVNVEIMELLLKNSDNPDYDAVYVYSHVSEINAEDLEQFLPNYINDSEFDELLQNGLENCIKYELKNNFVNMWKLYYDHLNTSTVSALYILALDNSIKNGLYFNIQVITLISRHPQLDEYLLSIGMKLF